MWRSYLRLVRWPSVTVVLDMDNRGVIEVTQLVAVAVVAMMVMSATCTGDNLGGGSLELVVVHQDDVDTKRAMDAVLMVVRPPGSTMAEVMVVTVIVVMSGLAVAVVVAIWEDNLDSLAVVGVAPHQLVRMTRWSQ